jgi:hypothetical protein
MLPAPSPDQSPNPPPPPAGRGAEGDPPLSVDAGPTGGSSPTEGSRTGSRSRSYRELQAEGQRDLDRGPDPKPTWQERCALAAETFPGESPGAVLTAIDNLRFGRWPVTRGTVYELLHRQGRTRAHYDEDPELAAWAAEHLGPAAPAPENWRGALDRAFRMDFRVIARDESPREGPTKGEQ